ncbi:DNA-binding protein [Bordetella pertussis]|nr:DNA-binding protein [Bordetella pertussis]
MAQIVGVSRQNMRKLMLAHPATFPAPIHEGSARSAGAGLDALVG